MSLRSRSLLAIVTTLLCVRLIQAQEEIASSTIRFNATTEPALVSVTEPPTGRENWGESELEFELATPTPVLPSNPPNTNQRRFPVKPASFTAPAHAEPLASAPVRNRPRPVVGVYTNRSAEATLNKIPRPAPVQRGASPMPVAQPTRQRGKPFQSVESSPTVSPYLNLYRNDVNSNSIPNYFALVRPQLDQLEANRRQAADMQRLQRQLQNSQSSSGSQPIMYGAADDRTAPVGRFMDTAQFYQRVHR